MFTSTFKILIKFISFPSLISSSLLLSIPPFSSSFPAFNSFPSFPFFNSFPSFLSFLSSSIPFLLSSSLLSSISLITLFCFCTSLFNSSISLCFPSNSRSSSSFSLFWDRSWCCFFGRKEGWIRFFGVDRGWEWEFGVWEGFSGIWEDGGMGRRPLRIRDVREGRERRERGMDGGGLLDWRSIG